MKPEHVCANHPADEAVSVCHNCHDWFCSRCLNEGQEYYYCNKPKCQKVLKAAKDLSLGKCPSCRKTVLLGAVHCGSCGKQLRELIPREKADDLVTVARFNHPVEAQLARTKLEARDIVSYIADEHLIAIDPLLNYTIGGVRLQVKKTELDKAARALDGKET